LKDEQFLANLFNVIDYLADWFGVVVDVGHDANRLLFCGRKVGTLGHSTAVVCAANVAATVLIRKEVCHANQT
jgi:hypothetical protein